MATENSMVSQHCWILCALSGECTNVLWRILSMTCCHRCHRGERTERERDGRQAQAKLGIQIIANKATQQRTAMSTPSTSTTTPTQQVNVADLELPQLVEVKKQLEEVCNCFLSVSPPQP